MFDIDKDRLGCSTDTIKFAIASRLVGTFLSDRDKGDSVNLFIEKVSKSYGLDKDILVEAFKSHGVNINS